MTSSKLSIFLFFIVIIISKNILSEDRKSYPSFNLNDWSEQIKQSFYRKIPEIKNKNFTDSELNLILKKISSNYPFEGLKIIESSGQLYLIGQQTTKIESINFNIATEINIDELKATINLSLDEAENEHKIQQAEDKIRTYLKNLGYRNSKVQFEYKKNENLKRYLIFNIDLGAKTVISQIQISDLASADQNEIEKSIYWFGVGEILSDDKIKSITQKLRTFLSQKGYYLIPVQSPQIFFNKTDTEARLNYKLQAKTKYQIEILGAKSYSNLFLATEILKLEYYFSTENNFGAELSEKLKIFYLDNGFSQFEVTYYERKVRDTIVLTLNIDEGSVVFIDKILVTGQISRPESFYVDRFLKLSSQKIQDRLWVRPDTEQSAKNLITSLQNEGFILAKFNRIDASPSLLNSKKINISLAIEEGPRTVLESVRFKNNIIFPNALLLKKMNLSSFLDLNELEKALLNLKVFYAENGYIEMQILNEKSNLIIYNSDFSKAKIEIDLKEGVPIVVGSIVLDGNKLTHDKLILTELEFKAGDLLTPQKIEESISRLQKTGHFTSIDIYTLEPYSLVKDRTVVIKVTERKPILLTAGLGATNENERTFNAYLGAAHRNFGGWGRGLSGRGELNYNDVFFKFLEKKITLGYLEPYLFDTRARFRINYTTQVNVSDVNLRKQTIANSAVWTVEQDFTSHITGIWDIYNITNYVEKGLTAEDEVTHNYSGEDFEIASTGPTLDIDYRDQVLNPQSGNFSRLSLEFASNKLGSHKVDDFVRATAQSTLYLPFLENKIVWANSIRGGYAMPTGQTTFGVPYDKKGFILGGRSTLRGFESNEFFPTSSTNNPEHLSANYHFTTPTSFQLIKSELRFPLFSKHDISGAIFYDGGQVLIDGIHFSDPYRDSIGIGFRYATPVGPLNLEYAQKLDRKPSESEGAFYLSVGVF